MLKTFNINRTSTYHNCSVKFLQIKRNQLSSFVLTNCEILNQNTVIATRNIHIVYIFIQKIYSFIAIRYIDNRVNMHMDKTDDERIYFYIICFDFSVLIILYDRTRNFVWLLMVILMDWILRENIVCSTSLCFIYRMLLEVSSSITCPC